MVEIAKDYVFDGPSGAVRFIDMFENFATGTNTAVTP
jgi:predicted dithiol-disulfide oxidoreductase (DUF899 family)